MRCLVCERIAIAYICRLCRERLLTPQPDRRTLRGDLTVLSFYDYGGIEPLLQAKYHPFGSRVLRHLALASLKPFFRDLELAQPTALIAVDDRPGEYFSHTAVLARQAHSRHLPYRPGSLQAQNRVRYAGESLAFRKAHPRNFRFRPFKENAAILIDDVVTTGSTIREAAGVLEKHKKTALFAVVLADADRA